MAAQSIGEPGTQLTMRTFHTGGIASGEDITQGLPRVEELFEARKPKGQAIISEIDGIVKITEDQKHKKIIVVTPATPEGEAITVNPNPDSEIEIEEKHYAIPYSATLKVKDGEFVEAGDLLTDGTVSPQEIMKIKGVRGVQKYIVTSAKLSRFIRAVVLPSTISTSKLSHVR